VIIKGLKGDFKPILAWFQEVYTHSSHLTALIVQEEAFNAAYLILNSLKPGFYSKSSDVALWTCKLLSKLGNDFYLRDMSAVGWEWFVSNNGGLEGVLYCANKYSDVNENVVAVLHQFGRFNFIELFSHYMKIFISDPVQYMRSVQGFIRPLSEYKLAKEEIINSGVMEYWIDMACKNADADGRHDPLERCAALSIR
jgi:hypothetical protein